MAAIFSKEYRDLSPEGKAAFDNLSPAEKKQLQAERQDDKRGQAIQTTLNDYKTDPSNKNLKRFLSACDEKSGLVTKKDVLDKKVEIISRYVEGISISMSSVREINGFSALVDIIETHGLDKITPSTAPSLALSLESKLNRSSCSLQEANLQAHKLALIYINHNAAKSGKGSALIRLPVLSDIVEYSDLPSGGLLLSKEAEESIDIYLEIDRSNLFTSPASSSVTTPPSSLQDDLQDEEHSVSTHSLSSTASDRQTNGAIQAPQGNLTKGDHSLDTKSSSSSETESSKTSSANHFPISSSSDSSFAERVVKQREASRQNLNSPPHTHIPRTGSSSISSVVQEGGATTSARARSSVSSVVREIKTKNNDGTVSRKAEAADELLNNDGSIAPHAEAVVARRSFFSCLGRR